MQPESAALAVARPHADGDLAVCRRLLARGSRSFSAAAWLLPGRVRRPATVFYAFCRVADDLVDDGRDAARAVDTLHRRLDRIYAASPSDDPVDRAMTDVVSSYDLPRGLLDALVEGFAWDADGRVYASIDEVRTYAARVGATVGMVMTLLMGERRPLVLARACDLGVAMQLTNIARDVGEDARRGRVYLPTRWMRQVGIQPQAWLDAPAFTPALGTVVARVLDEAARLYARARPGIGVLPADCRPAIRAAAAIYADIGRVIAARGHDSVGARAHTSGVRKLWLLLRARLARRESAAGLQAPPLRETAFLVDAVWGAPP